MRRNSRKGSALVYLIVLGGVVALGAVYGLQLIHSVRFAVKDSAQKTALNAEHHLLQQAAAALVRAELLKNNSDPFETLTAARVQDFSTRDPRTDSANGFLVTDVGRPSAPPFFSLTPQKPTNATAGHALGGAASLDHAFSVPILIEGPNNGHSSGRTFMWRSRLTEIPASEAGLVALGTFRTDLLPFPISTATCLAPLGLAGGNGPYPLSSTDILSPTTWTAGTSVADTARQYVRPGLSVSWMMNPYELTALSPVYPFERQALSTVAEVLRFDGHSLEGLVPPAVTVESSGGVPRVVVRVEALPDSNILVDPAGDPTAIANQASVYYIDCTSPLARARGVVLVGSGILPRRGDVIMTNGRLELFGEQTGGPILAGTSYGAVVFNASVQSPVWRAFICAPTAPPAVTHDFVPTGAPEVMFGADLDGDEVEVRVSGSQAGAAVGISLQPGQVPQVTFSDIGAQVQMSATTRNGTSVMYNQLTKTVGAPYGFRYSRAMNRVSMWSDVMVSNPASFSTAAYAPYLHTGAVTTGGTVGAITITVRPRGTSFYRAGAVESPVVQGGVLVGDRLSGDLLSLVVTQRSLDGLFNVMPRLVLFDP